MNLIIGQKASQTRKFSKEEVLAFSKLTADDNPIHFDDDYASGTRFKKIIVQGPMVVSLNWRHFRLHNFPVREQFI